jgi:hypothetical protein
MPGTSAVSPAPTFMTDKKIPCFLNALSTRLYQKPVAQRLRRRLSLHD